MKWLWELHEQKCGGIIADEMGLGKVKISFLKQFIFRNFILDNSNNCLSSCISL